MAYLNGVEVIFTKAGAKASGLGEGDIRKLSKQTAAELVKAKYAEYVDDKKSTKK